MHITDLPNDILLCILDSTVCTTQVCKYFLSLSKIVGNCRIFFNETLFLHHLSSNLILNESIDTLNSLKSILFLSISNSKLYTIPHVLCSDRLQIKTLVLQKSCIYTIPTDMYKLHSLCTLNLAHNFVEYITTGSLPNSLFDIDISYNCLRSLSFIDTLTNLIQIKANKNNLSDIDNTYVKIKKINISDNHINTINLSSYQYVEELKINRNCLVSCVINNISLNHLIRLDITNNMLLFIPSCIKELTSLQSLNLSHNKIKIINNIQLNMPLVFLNLSYNYLSSLPVFGKNIQSCLKRLYCQFNCLQSLSPQICQLSVIENVNISHNRLKLLPKKMSLLKRIKYIYISHNSFRSYPSFLHNLQSIEIIDISHNFIVRNILANPKLLTMNISFNKIQTIPFYICKFYNLENIDLTSNQISWISNRFAQISNLKSVYLDHNNILVLSLNNFPSKIKKISASFNNIYNIINESHTQLNYLTYLNINHNNIRRIPSIIFDISNLECLDLSYNFVANVPFQISNLKRLKRLYINNNNLYCINKGLLHIYSLQVLAIANNCIKTPLIDIRNLSQLHYLDMSGHHINYIKDIYFNVCQLKYLNIKSSPDYYINEQIKYYLIKNINTCII